MTRRLMAGQVDTVVTFSTDTWKTLELIARERRVEPEQVAAAIVREFARQQPEHRPYRPPVKEPRKPTGAAAEHRQRVSRDDVRDLWGKGMSDPAIAKQLGVTGPAITRIRKHELKLPANYGPGGSRVEGQAS